jgi:AcrR family transcriptional regulator
MDTSATDRTRVLEAADTLYYAHGIQSVGMDRIRDAAQVPLKRIYKEFPSKSVLVEAYLHRRDRQARDALRAHTATQPTAEARILSVFDWMHTWFQQPEFRGCPLTNAFGELGRDCDLVAQAVRDHMNAIREHLHTLAAETTTPDPEALSWRLHILVAGATSQAMIHDRPDTALQAKVAAESLLESLPGRAGG